jgi:hypothetical protein
MLQAHDTRLGDSVAAGLLPVTVAAGEVKVSERKTLTLDGAKNVLAAGAESTWNKAPGGVMVVVGDGGKLMTSRVTSRYE